MKKIKMLAILVIASVLFVPNVFADTDPKLGTVEKYEPADSVKQAVEPVMDASNQNRITVTYSGITKLVVQPADEGKKRYEEAAWFGFKVNAPTEGLQEAKAKLRRLKMDSDTHGGVEGDYRVWNWTDAKENEGSYVYVYTSVTQEELEAAAAKKGGVVSKTWEFDWDGDGTYEQVLEVILDPQQVTLLPEGGREDTPLFTPAKYEEIQSNIVTVTFDFMGQQESMEVQKGSVLDEEGIAGLYAINLEELGLEGYVLEGYYADPEFTTKYDFTKPFNSDVTIYMHAVKKAEQVVTPTEAEK